MSEVNNRIGNKEPIRPVEESASAKPLIIDHLARARARVAEYTAIHGDDDYSEVYVDKWFAKAPEGWVYEWKTFSVWNKEYPQYINAMQHNGWSPVEASRHRELLYPEYEGEKIIIDGMILMERPKELTERVRDRELRQARDSVRNSERKLADAPAGTAPRTAHAETTPRVRSHVGPVSITD